MRHDDDLRTADDLRAAGGVHRAPAAPAVVHDEHGPTFGPLLFVPCFLLFLAALWLMGLGMDTDNGLLFSLGVLASGVAFIIPMHLLRS